MARRRYNFFLDDELRDGLRRIKAQDGIPEAEQIRRAVEVWLKRRGVKSDRTRTSTRKRP